MQKTAKTLKNSKLEKKIKKIGNLNKKEFENLRVNSLKTSIFLALFVLLFVELYLHNFVLNLAISVISFIIFFIFLINYPLLKRKKYVNETEAELTNFLTNLITELKVGKDLLTAINNCSKEGKIGIEYQKLLSDIQNGFSFLDAIINMNNRLNSLVIKRANSNLHNIYLHGTNIHSLKKLNEDLLLKQRIESKEFSGKMVVYSLVFIVVSAIVPAMFSSFILIGSFFMQLTFTAWQIFFIIVVGFPLLDFLILQMINSKTPTFLRN